MTQENLGRPLLEAVYAYKVLQDEEVLERCARKVTEELYWKWTGRFKRILEGIRLLRRKW
jgi:hypothetical protein